VLQTVAGEGDTLAVGVIIARVGAARGGEQAHPASASPSAGSGRGPVTGGPAGVRAGGGAAAGGGSHPGSEPATRGRPGAGARVKASPLARRVAHERGVDLGTVAGTGPGGRITRADVQAAPERGAPPRALEEPARAPSPSPAAPGPAGLARAKGTTSTVELS